MRRILMRSLSLVVLATLAGLCRAEVSLESVERGKRATALVEIGAGEAYGTAFCIDAAGYFVTTRHVAQMLEEGKRLTLIVRPGEKDEKRLVAKAVRLDSDSDLALLRIEKPPKLTTLEVGETNSLAETQPVTAFGYPFGKGAVGENTYPGVTVSRGRITGLHKQRGELEEIQLDAALFPGDSGGPVLNGRGQVIGVVFGGIPSAHIQFAIPINRLLAFLARTEIYLAPTLLLPDRIYEPQDFVIQVITLSKPRPDTTVELTLSVGPGDRRAYTARSTDGRTFRLKAPPAPGVSGPTRLQITVKDAEGERVYTVADRTLRVDNRSLLLSGVRQIERGDKTTLTLTDGQTLTGNVVGLDVVEAERGSMAVLLDLSHAASVGIEPSLPELSTITYHIVVRQGGKILAERSGALTLTDGLFANWL